MSGPGTIMKFFAVLLLLTAILLSGCETLRALGRDIQTAGDWIEREASK